jgi:two-component system, chemotaxis family, CheB/CheR fusion protein
MMNQDNTRLNEQLQVAYDDLNNLLNHSGIAIVLLDKDLCVRHFNAAAADVFNITDTDIGRPLAGIASKLTYQGAVGDAREVLKKPVARKIEVQRQDGRWYLLRVLPYRTNIKIVKPYHTSINIISGVVISLFDIDEQKRAVEALREANRKLQDELKKAIEE